MHKLIAVILLLISMLLRAMGMMLLSDDREVGPLPTVTAPPIYTIAPATVQPTLTPWATAAADTEKAGSSGTGMRSGHSSSHSDDDDEATYTPARTLRPTRKPSDDPTRRPEWDDDDTLPEVDIPDDTPDHDDWDDDTLPEVDIFDDDTLPEIPVY